MKNKILIYFLIEFLLLFSFCNFFNLSKLNWFQRTLDKLDYFSSNLNYNFHLKIEFFLLSSIPMDLLYFWLLLILLDICYIFALIIEWSFFHFFKLKKCYLSINIFKKVCTPRKFVYFNRTLWSEYFVISISNKFDHLKEFCYFSFSLKRPILLT